MRILMQRAIEGSWSGYGSTAPELLLPVFFAPDPWPHLPREGEQPSCQLTAQMELQDDPGSCSTPYTSETSWIEFPFLDNDDL